MKKALIGRVGLGLVAILSLGVLPAPASADEEAKAKIQVLEAQLAQKNGQFDWMLHNELRHYYGAVDHDREFHHTNVILKHSLMDEYMMNILSGWEIGKDRAKAIENLRRFATSKKDFPFVAAACWVKAGELENTGSKEASERARTCFKNALDVKGDGLEPYYHLAKTWLENLDLPEQP
jgi:hypothetical protein